MDVHDTKSGLRIQLFLAGDIAISPRACGMAVIGGGCAIV
jgi:hypothetical protein